jgi:hypothetical protein
MPGPTIVCVSANPAMDRRLRMESLAVGEINRATSTWRWRRSRWGLVRFGRDFLGARSARNARGKWKLWELGWLPFPLSPEHA